MADRLELEARFNDRASAGVKRLGKVLESVRPSNGMQAAQTWMSNFRVAADKANVAVRPLATGLSAVGIGGLAASLSMGELVKQFKDLADSTLTMKELGRQSRLSATEIARLQYAAGKLHVDPAAVGGAISGWSSKMVEFRRHTSEFYTYLLRQNADVARKIGNDSPVDALKDTLDYISRIKDPQIQKRVADLAGVGDLTPMFGKGPQGLAEAFAEAGREVKPITAELQAAADRFNDATNRFNQSWTNLKNDLGPSVLDPLSHTIDKLDQAMKFAAQYPGDAAAAAAIIAGSFAALYARMRIMRGSMIAGGAGAAGEMAGAAREQVKAGTSLIEAAVALKEAAAELRGRGAAPGGGGTTGGSPSGPGTSPGYANLTPGAVLAALNIFDLANNATEQLRKLQANPDKDVTDPSMEWAARTGDAIRHFFQGGGAGSDLKKDVQEGSKAGIVAGLRELAQQQQLDGGSGPTSNAGAGHMLGRGAANMRYGRRGGGGDGAFRGTPVPEAPYNGKNIEGLSPEASRKYASILGNRESGNRYGTTNSYGYAGRWQFGASALAENGYVRPGTTNAGLRSPGSWTGKGGIGSLSDWLANKNGSQDQALGEYTNRHYAQLKAAGVIRDGMSQSEIAGWLAAAHLKGVGGAIALSHGRDNADANGTSASSYRRMMQGVGAPASASPGAGTPAPSSAAIGDAAVFAARQRILNGGSNPADRALIERYKVQQGTVQAHASGGAIRGPGGPRSDSIPAWLSNGEFVVNARASGEWLPFLHAINSGHAFADGGQVDAGLSRRRSWLNFFQRSSKDGGMGAARHVAAGATAMMMGESGRNLDPKLYGWDVNGPSGGTAQWHDVTKGPGAGRVHRLSDLMSLAMLQHEDWHSVPLQQANWKREAQGPMAYAWNAMRHARTATGALKAGIDRFEVPADKHLEMLRRMPNIVRLAREGVPSSDGRITHQIDPVQIDIRHHNNGGARVSARGGRGTRLGIKSGPTMQTS